VIDLGLVLELALLASGPAAFLAQVSTQVEEEVRWLRFPPAWVTVLVIVPIVVAFSLAFYRREHLIGKSGWRWVLAALRVLLILLVLGMLAEPVRRKTTYETRDSTLVVLVDDSLSMDIADRFSDRDHVASIATFLESSAESIESTSRYDLVRRLFSDSKIGFLEKLRSKGNVVLSTFARSAEERARWVREGTTSTPGEAAAQRAAEQSADVAIDPLPPYATVRADARVQETRIGESIRDAVAAVIGSGFGGREERVSGVLVVTDGQENSGSVPSLEIARRLGERGTPIHILGIGNPDPPRDIRIVNVDASDVVLVDDIAVFDVTIAAEGFAGERVSVRLEVDGRNEDTEYVSLLGDGREQPVRLDYRPRRAGEATATISVDKLGGEVFHDNNVASRTIRILDEKIRILYIENLPRWEYRFLQHAFVRDLTTETHVWLFSADDDFVQESSPSIQPLVEFPTSREALFRYHVIIIGDVDPALLGADVCSHLKDFVDEGGGLIFISGRHANPAKYARTDLYPVLPVEVPESVAAAGDFRPVTESFKVRLTPEGRQLPLIRLDNDSERNQRLWEDEADAYYNGLSPFFWYAQAGREKASTVVLARHPRDEDPIHRTGRVIFAYMSYGRGRSFFSAVDNTWRWRAGVENLYFYRFWGQIARFVAAGRLLGQTPRFQVSTDKLTYRLGETVSIDARVFDVNMKPSQDKTVTLYHSIEGREGTPPEVLQLALNEVKGAGSYEGTLSASVRGRHDVWLGSESERMAFRTFTVEIPALETRDPRLDRPFLEKLASAGGGKYFDLPQALEAVDMLQGVTRSQTGSIEGDALWDESWVVLLFTVLITLEWILRKRVRLT
jgi:hypothetical protein